MQPHFVKFLIFQSASPSSFDYMTPALISKSTWLTRHFYEGNGVCSGHSKMTNKCHFKNRLITQPLSPGQHDFCLRSAATNERLHHFCNVAKAVPKYCEFWFEVTVNMIWSNFQTFDLFPLFLRKNIEAKFAGEKKTSKTFLLYFTSFSVIYSLHGFFESRARRANFPNVLFHNFSLFPYISMFSGI